MNTVYGCALHAQSELRGRTGLAWPSPWNTATADRWLATCDYLAAAIPDLTPALAGRVGRALERADRAVRRACGADDDQQPIHAPCPACGRRGTLHAQTSDPNPARWVVRCNSRRCTCTGAPCPCRIPGRQAGTRHTWPSTAFPLDRIRREAA